jgi:hypothetical protein
MNYQPRPLTLNTERLSGLSSRLITSHHQNNYAGAVKRLNAIRGELAGLDWNAAATFTINGLKREELIAANSAFLHELYFDTRHYVKRAKGDVFVITGPVFTDAGPRIGANGVKVPTYLYKLVYDATTQRAWAHWQENREGETVGRPVSYQELVKRTGVEFLPRSALQH